MPSRPGEWARRAPERDGLNQRRAGCATGGTILGWSFIRCPHAPDQGAAMDEPHLSVQAAANRVGLTEFGLRKAIDRGELRPVPGTLPLRLDAGDVERLISARRTAAIQRLTARGVDLVQLAKDARMFLRPPAGAPSSGGVSRVGADVVAVFGAAAVNAAAIQDPSVCGWCATTVAARMLGTRAPAYSAAYAALLGPPCAKDTAVVADAMAKLDGRVNAGAQRPARARTEPAVSPRPATPPQTSPAAVQGRVGAAPGRASMSTLSAALRAAGGVSTARYRGKRNCGHLVAEQCGCPRASSRVVTASVGAHTHGCGCGCSVHGAQR